MKKSIKVEYKREDLPQVNPQLYEWLAIVNDKPSTPSIVQDESDVVNSDGLTAEDTSATLEETVSEKVEERTVSDNELTMILFVRK